MIQQPEHALRRLQAEVTFLADFGPLSLPADGTHAFRFRVVDSGMHPATIDSLCLYYGNRLVDQVELSFLNGPVCTTTLGAAGQAGQPVSVRIRRQPPHTRAGWSYSTLTTRPSLRSTLLGFWRVGGGQESGETPPRRTDTFLTDFLTPEVDWMSARLA